jgi:[ribosomal protein S18]-alanine N-acetyltransferase
LTSDSFVIRSLSEEDCGRVVSLASDLGLSPWTLNDYRQELKRPDSEMIVALDRAEVAGFIVGRRVPGPDDSPDAEIYNIGVDPAYQRCGAGTRLLQEFTGRCRRKGVRCIWLEVRARNLAAIEFYEKFGFAEYAIRPRFYNKPADDAVVMRFDRIQPDG